MQNFIQHEHHFCKKTMYNRLMTKQKGTLTFPGGGEYTGELKNGNANGLH